MRLPDETRRLENTKLHIPSNKVLQDVIELKFRLSFLLRCLIPRLLFSRIGLRGSLPLSIPFLKGY